MKNIKIFKIMFILIIIQEILSNYPEDYSTIDQLTNPENKDKSYGDEIFLGAYYFSSSSDPLYDYRNGIKILPQLSSLASPGDCTYTNGIYSGNDDNQWDYSTISNAFYPSSISLIASCIKNSNIELNLKSFINSDDLDIISNQYNLIYIFYFWFEQQNNNVLQIKCKDSSGTSVSINLSKGFYQIYLKYEYTQKKFSFDTTEFDCPSMEIIISDSLISLHKIKVSTLVTKEKIANNNCNDNTLNGKCPESYYCEINSGKCKKCRGFYRKCTNFNTALSCGRFTEEWINAGTVQNSCSPEYFNLQKLGEMSFDIIPPIRSNAASLSFWFFTLTDINENVDYNPNIYHISLEDFFVITIIPGKDKYIVYLTAYQMYHEAYGEDIQKLKTKNEFLEALGKFPYINWYKNKEVDKMNRWINIIATFNKNVPRIGLQIFYKKKEGNYGNIATSNKEFKDLDGEYIYNNENNKIQSQLHFKKYYRNYDAIHLNVNIYDNNINVYIRKIYVYASELLITSTSNSEYLFGFQYIEYEKIFPVSNNLMPELVLSVPFDKISPVESTGEYSIQYYMYDMSKIYNNRLTKNLRINIGNIDDSLYDYDPRLYRLNLLSEKNKEFKDSLLIDLDDIECNTNKDYCYSNGRAYVCNTGYYIKPDIHDCTNTINTKILVAGINAVTNRMGMLTDVCYGNTCVQDTITQYKCNKIKLFEACISGNYEADTIVYFYYSYFFKLPPIKLSLKNIYKSYYIQFNFLYETNSALRPKNNLKGKKLYLFYTDAFRIWHDYSMKYLGIEDNQGNPSKNLIPNFNTENENIFTISVIYDEINNIYKGKIFLNGVKIYMPSFTGGQLSYILFCHNDTACPVNNEVYWTSGFYNYIKIYDISDLKVILNDNSFYSQYIYNNYYSYYNYDLFQQRFNSYPVNTIKDEIIKMTLENIEYNKIGGYSITSYYENVDKMQMFNYGIDQSIPLRILKSGINSDIKKYIDKNYNIRKCPNSLFCYGDSNNIFSEQSLVCKNTKFYKYDNCEDFPTSPKNKYFTLALPLKENLGLSQIDYTFSFIKQKFEKNSSDKIIYNSGKITFTFWLKLLGFKNSEMIFQLGSGNNICYLYYEDFNKLSLICEKAIKTIIFYNYYIIPKINYGKYMHLSIAISFHKYWGKGNDFFISFQVNNANVQKINGISINNLKSELELDYFININKFTLFTQIYGQISKFYIYNEALIGGYAYNTNTYFSFPVYKLIDDTKESCLLEEDTDIDVSIYKCINEYDLDFNDDLYISSGYPLDKIVHTTKNNHFKNKKCSEKCGSFCYGVDEDQCACATKGFYDYIFTKDDYEFECKKLPYLDFKRYERVIFTFNENKFFKGFDFWFYLAQGVREYNTQDRLLFQISCEDISDSNVLLKIHLNIIRCKDVKYETDNINDMIFNIWFHVFCFEDDNYKMELFSNDKSIFVSRQNNTGWRSTCNKLIFYNGENELTSPGIIFLRQFKFWSDISKLKENINININQKEEMFYTEFINNENRDYLLLSIDSFINPDKIFYSYPSGFSVSLEKKSLHENNYEPFYGYYPLKEELPKLELCLETEECKDILNLQAIEDLEFENIIPSGTGRYTMEFWIKIKSVKFFLNGINVIWKNLISISILTDTLKNKLSIYCFPQDYLTSPFNFKGRELIDLASTAKNKDNIDIDINDFENFWIFIRCAYNWDNNIYYLSYNGNSLPPKEIDPENASQNQKVDYPFKYLFNGYEKYNFYIKNANLNENCEIYIRTLYLYIEYLPSEYDTQRVLFTFENKVEWITFCIDFFNFTDNKLNYFKKKKNKAEDIRCQDEFNIISNDNYLSKGGIILCKANDEKKYDSDKYECIDDPLSIDSHAMISYGSIPLQCETGYYLTFSNTGNLCEKKCPIGYNRGPGSHLDMDYPIKTALCNYIINKDHDYNEPSNFEEKLTCLNELIRVGYKCFSAESQKKAALYFNRCYNFYPVFAYFDKDKLKFINGYILEFSFKIDLVNDFCSKEGIDERYIFYAHPHAIFQDKDDKFYYKDTNDLSNKDKNQKLDQISLYEWNHIIIEFNPKELKINIYINYNVTDPAYSYIVEESNINDYYIKNVLFCTGEYLCAPLKEDEKLDWGVAYYTHMRIYDLEHSSVFMVYENMRKKFNFESNSILVYYSFNTINNDLNTFHDIYNDNNLDFNDNRPIVSVYRAEDRTLMFSSSSNFDYGEFDKQKYVISVEKITGKYTSDDCYPGCKRCYSSNRNDCYECNNDFELYNNQCREITGYYFQLPNYNNKEIEIKTGSILKENNPITITLWVKYYGIIKNFKYDDGNTCIVLIRFSTEDEIFLCHEQENNNLLMNGKNQVLYEDTLFLENLGTWQLLSVSNYKCYFNNENTCEFFPSMFSFAINGKVIPRKSTYRIPDNGFILNKITFGYGIIMLIADLNIYNSFILNPLGIISNFLSYYTYLITSLNFHLSSPSNCIDKQVLIATDGRDMYYYQNEFCIKDYNIFHEIENHNCDDEDKMINLNSIDNECIDCIDECKHCAGESKLNCACYNNDIYWFRKDKDTNRLFCQLVPYIDLNKYSDLQFNEIKYATSNEFAIEFWYFIYEYNNTEIKFNKQIISWENHIKIEISKYSNDAINIECFPINEKDESISSNDISQKYFQWNHIICATDLNNKVYYLNEGKINNIIGEPVKQLNYSKYEDRRVNLRFQSYNNYDDKTSNGVFLLKELRLYNFFSIREFDTKCFYNYDWAKNNNIPNILHYFPFKMKKDGIIQDSQGNLPSQQILKSNLLGYNVIDYENKYNIDETFKECLIIFVIPSKVYFNLTNVLIYNYEISPKLYPFYDYKYEYYISKNGEVSYNEITKINLNALNNPKELLLKKFKDTKYNGVQLNIYITLTEKVSKKVHYGFNLIKIKSYYPGYDLDLETYCRGLQDNLEVDLENLGNKYDFSETEIWNRLNLIQSLGEIHNMALNESNRTTTFLDYYYDENAISYFPENIIIKNPICYEEFCSGKGKCIIVVRTMTCLCDEGYSGRNCHITTKNKNYLSETHLKMWNYLTNNNELSTLSIDNKLLDKLTYLVKSSTIFDDSYNELIKNYFNLIEYLKLNNLNLIMNEIKLIFDTFIFILINMYYDTSQFKAKNYDSKLENPDYKNNETIDAINLNYLQLDTIYEISNKITNIIPELILTIIKLNKKDIFENYTAFDYSIKSVSHSFDYLEYFDNLHINNREKYNSYLPFIDAYNCADYIFGSTGYSTIFLVIINYHYDPL